MHRFFVPVEATQGSEITLPDHEAHHAVNVLRLKDHERVVVLNGAGEELLCETLEVSRRAVRLHLLQRNAAKPLPTRVSLLQAVPKAKAMDFIVQKATELGAARVVPLLSERTVGHWEDDTAAHKATKWRTTAIEAAKQCGTPWLPAIESPLSVAQYLARHERFDLALIASLQPGAVHPRARFQSYDAEHHQQPRSVCIWVGPEGDFTPAEINTIRGAGALPITLGPLVLRSETAAIYCLSILSYELNAL